jgi:hypothetical protein
MATKRTGRKRGRPHLPLRVDPARHELAFFDALTAIAHTLGNGISERQIAIALMGLKIGVPVDTPDTLKAITEGRPFEIFCPPEFVKPKRLRRFRNLGEERPSVCEPRDQSIVNAMAGDLVRKVNKFRNMPEDSEDKKWLSRISAALYLTLRGNGYGVTGMVGDMAADGGELAYFEAVLAPYIRERQGGEPRAKRIRRPELNPHAAA